MAQVVVEMSGDEAKLYRAYQRIIDQAKKLDGAVKDNKRSHDEAFGDRAAAQVGGLIGRYVSMATAIGGVAAAIKSVRDEADRLGQAQRISGPGLGQLAQLAETPGEMARLVKEAKATFAEGGARTLQDAAAMQFALESAGAGAMRGDFSRLQATGVVPNAQLMVEAASKLQKAFGEEKTGDLSRIVSTAFGGGKIGLGSAEQLLSGAAGAGVYAQRIGLSPEEAMAAVSTVSGTLGPEQAGTATEQLFKQIETQGIVKKRRLKRAGSLQEYLTQIQDLEKKGVPISQILGDRSEATVAYGLLTNAEGRDLYGANMVNIAQAQRENWMQRKLDVSRQIPENLAAMTAQTAENRGQLGAGRAGVMENLADALEEDLVTKYRQRYGRFGGIAAAGERLGINIDRLMGNEQFLRRYGEEGSAETQQAILQVLQNIDNNTREQGGRQRASAAAQVE